MKKLRFRRVKEGSFRTGMSMILMGIMLLPVPHLTAQTRTVPDEQINNMAQVWQTELVLADAAPMLLASKNEIPIEKVPSRHQEELARIEAERRNAEEQRRVEAQKQKPTPSPSPITASASCDKNISENEKWEWAAKAASSQGIPTQLLIAVWQVESGKQFCTSVQSYAGAMGPMQFMPGTWKRYAKDGNGDGVSNVLDARDALFGASHLLAANGASHGDYRRALYAYNHANWYVNKVLALANL